jgi:type VI secretion system protein
MSITLRVEMYCQQALPQPMVKRLDRLGGAIGRAPGNDLVLDDPSKYISRTHARITFHDGIYYLTDVGSNPSLINDRPLGTGRQMLLADGDRLNIGEYQLQVTLGAEAAPLLLAPSPLQVAPAPADQLALAQSLSRISDTDSLLGASILDFGDLPDLNTGTALGIDLFGANGSGAGWTSAPASFVGAESDHVSPEIFAFPIEVAATTPAVAGVVSVAGEIPDDYDPLADFLPPRIVAASVVAIAPFIEPPALVPVVAVPVSVSAFQPPPVAPAAVRPVASFSAAPSDSSSSSAATASDGAVLQALLRGLGLCELDTKLSAPELAELVGAMLRESTVGTMGVLMARAVTKRESRLEMTMIGSVANNPLKFFPDAAHALAQMLASPHPGYMAPVAAYANAYDDLKAHELAMMAGMNAALAGVLQRFDPLAIEQRLQVPGVFDKLLMANRKAKLWDRLVELYKDMSNEVDDDFQRLFGEKFGVAYEEQMQRLRQGRK